MFLIWFVLVINTHYIHISLADNNCKQYACDKRHVIEYILNSKLNPGDLTYCPARISVFNYAEQVLTNYFPDTEKYIASGAVTKNVF